MSGIIFEATSDNPAVKNPKKSPLSDGAGSYIDGTSTIIAGPVPLISLGSFLITDFNGDGQLDVFMNNAAAIEAALGKQFASLVHTA